MATRAKVGLIGCGNISGAYVKGCTAFRILDVVACADIVTSRAEARAREFGIPNACPVDELLSDPEIQIVVNLTVPQAHAEVSLAAISAGKNVHSEKPLAVAREDGRRVLAAAREQRVLVGCAPDTFLGGGLQTCRKLIDDGWIGKPVAATAFMTSRGPESWHPDPEFLYQLGAGPLFDMGPYYLTALVNLLGPVKRVTGSTQISFPERLITSQPHYGTEIKVRTPTHVAGVVDFGSGAVGTIITSFDVWAANLPRIEIYGSEGSLSVPDPNTFGGPVRIWRPEAGEWREVPLTHSTDVGRGIGVADMAHALAYGRPHRASGELAYHVLDVMHAFEEASKTGGHVEIESHCPRPAPLPMGLRPGELDC
ncbi:MAG TPA: Gfo/Idh/MocA family oxidoreductase [Anaerolineae bacterium]|nr:Gfo/Idh/MocA family oxidoreductase [Anaerolineae bacterium]